MSIRKRSQLQGQLDSGNPGRTLQSQQQLAAAIAACDVTGGRYGLGLSRDCGASGDWAEWPTPRKSDGRRADSPEIGRTEPLRAQPVAEASGIPTGKTKPRLGAASEKCHRAAAPVSRQTDGRLRTTDTDRRPRQPVTRSGRRRTLETVGTGSGNTPVPGVSAPDWRVSWPLRTVDLSQMQTGGGWKKQPRSFIRQSSN